MSQSAYEAVIDTFARELARTQDELVEALRGRAAYWSLATMALAQLHAHQAREERHREERERLVDDLRRLRAFLIRGDREKAA
jgi:hypothetical protein